MISRWTFNVCLLLCVFSCYIFCFNSLGNTSQTRLKQRIQAIAHPAQPNNSIDLPLYPDTLEGKPEIPSPYRAENGMEYLTVVTDASKYSLFPVTVKSGESIEPWNVPLEIDATDFPTLAKIGLHSEIELDAAQRITGRSIAEITELGRPGRLSSSGFLCEDEDVMSVIKGDNRLVKKLGLNHLQTATPLIHLCHMIRCYSNHHHSRTHIHTWKDQSYILYNGKKIFLEVTLTKGGQKSIFNDGDLDGAWGIKIWRDLDTNETKFLTERYNRLDENQRKSFVQKLSQMMLGEIVPFYIYRYGFYEGHTGWRADPIAIAFIFGLKSIGEIENTFPGKLDYELYRHFTNEN